jgi:Sulfotransferase domain
MPSPEPPLPAFLIIGAQKSATRWLRYNLGLHPEIFTPRVEVSFFNSAPAFKQRGVDWYREQFAGWSGERMVGEATPGYMIWRHHPPVVAKRIKDSVPDVRLIAILRNPVDRANSAMVHHIKRGRLPKHTTLLEHVRAQPPEADRFGLVTGGWYAASLRPFQRLFGDQLLVLLHDAVRADPLGVYETSLRHVGATAGFVPAELDQVVFSNQEGESAPWRKDVPPEERAQVYEYFRDDIIELERTLGRDLSMWKPDPDAVDYPSWARTAVPGIADHFAVASSWIESIIGNGSVDGSEPAALPTNGELRAGVVTLVARTHFFAETLTRREMPSVDWNADIATVDVPDTDLVGAYRNAAGTLHAALAERRNLKGVVSTPPVTVRASVFAATALAHHVVEGWDLADAARSDARIPSSLVEAVGPVARYLATQEVTAAKGYGFGRGSAPTPMSRFVGYLDASRA